MSDGQEEEVDSEAEVFCEEVGVPPEVLGEEARGATEVAREEEVSREAQVAGEEEEVNCEAEVLREAEAGAA